MEFKKQELNQFSNFKHQDKLWVSAAKAAYEAQLMRKHYQELEDKLLEELKKISDESSIGGGFVFESITRKGTIDYKSIPQLKQIDLEIYRKESNVSWKLYKV